MATKKAKLKNVGEASITLSIDGKLVTLKAGQTTEVLVGPGGLLTKATVIGVGDRVRFPK